MNRPSGIFDRALEGLRVVDFSQIAAGPLCGMLLGDLGADVIKVEQPTGDIGRTLGPPFIEGDSPSYLALNRNKRGVCIDLKTAAGVEAAHKLLRGADVLIESYRPGVAARLGIGFEKARTLSPRLIYCSISAYGQTGPWSGKPGVDGMLQAVTGLMSITGAPGEPSKVQAPIVDMVTGYHATIAILSALQRRDELTGPIDISLYAASMMLQQIPLTSYLNTGELPQRCGSGAPYATPNEAYRTADGHIFIAAYQDSRWNGFCRALGRPELADDRRFDSLAARLRNRTALTAEIEQVLHEKPTSTWLAVLDEADIICATVSSYADLMETPQLASAGIMTTIAHEGAKELIVPGFSIGGPSSRPRLSPPRLGEHNSILDMDDPWQPGAG